MSDFRWTWRDALRLWIYNRFKRPVHNFLWAIGYYDGGAFRRKFPDHPWGYPKAAPMTRAMMEWAHNSFTDYDCRKNNP